MIKHREIDDPNCIVSSPSILPSIHPFTHHPFSSYQVVMAGRPRLPSNPQHFPVHSGEPRGLPSPAVRYNSSGTSWVFTRRSTASTPSSLLMSELLTLSLRLNPATVRRKLMLAVCIRDLLHSVMSQSY